jgi:hypothetical protein
MRITSEGFDMKVLGEILRLRKQDKEKRGYCSTCIPRPWTAPACRKRRRRSLKSAPNFGFSKEDWIHRASIFNQPFNNQSAYDELDEREGGASLNVADAIAPTRCA